MLRLVLALSSLLLAAPAVPRVLDHPETCLTCHPRTAGLGTYHDPRAIGCASCHGGNPGAEAKAAAHAGMRLIPGNLQDAQASCGASGCHPDAPARVASSLMATMAGVVAIDRQVFGEAHAAPHAVTSLTHSPADTHLRSLCASCHLGGVKTTAGPITPESRGGGCNACHLVYTGPSPIPDAERRGEKELRHPGLRINASDSHCFGCHSRSGRISLSYQGLAEAMRPYPKGAKVTRLPDGRAVMHMPADVHAKRLQCIDCHTAGEVMGDGLRHASKAEAVHIACADCHTSAPQTVDFAALAPEEQRAVIVRGWDTGSAFVRGRRGDANLLGSSFRDGSVFTLPRAGGRPLAARVSSPQCSAPAHGRLTCESCHSAWAPRCNSCHMRFDAKAEGYDLFTDTPVNGAWFESSSGYGADAPTLGVRTNREGREEITPFVPGMILALENRAQRRLFAPLAPHTVQREARACRSCHQDPQALGYGRGALTYATAGTTGAWRFVPAERRAADGLPADAWIGFRDGRGGDTLRATTRAFTTAEQDRILRVGACLRCHEADGPVMTPYLSDPVSHRNRTGPRCAAPVQQGVTP